MVRKGWKQGENGIRSKKDGTRIERKKKKEKRERRCEEKRDSLSLSTALPSFSPSPTFSPELRLDRLGPCGPLHRRLVPLEVREPGLGLAARELPAPRRRRKLLERLALGERLRQHRLLRGARDVDLDVGEGEALEVEGLADGVGAVDERLDEFFFG